MKLVWLVNTILPQIAAAQGKGKEVIGGWTVQLSEIIASMSEIEFTVFYPQHDTKENIVGNAGNISYVGFYEDAAPELKYDPEITKRIKGEIDRIEPDIVHIWGTEFVHTLSMVRAFMRPERTVISIQGLISRIGEVYDSGVPEKVVRRHTFRDLIRKDSIAEQKDKFLRRGECEIAALKECGNVIGRTGWDKKGVLEINPELNYYHAGEILRKEFYKTGEKWDPKKCGKHRIFMTQSYYPIKGIHFVLEALKEIKKQYPDVKLVVTGKDMRPHSVKDKIKQDSYSKYICELIAGNDLDQNVEFIGTLDAAEMVGQYLGCSAFLLPSVVENSSNSLGEAMMLGVPCIAARTGGTPDMIGEDEGWLYEFNNTEELIWRITEVFRLTDDPKESGKNSERLQKACIHAQNAYDVEENRKAYLSVYEDVLKD